MASGFILKEHMRCKLDKISRFGQKTINTMEVKLAIPSPFSVTALVKEVFPKGFIKALLEGMQAMYRQSHDEDIKRHGQVEFAHKALQYDWWLLGDAVLRTTAERFGLFAKIKTNKARNCPYSEVHIGDVVLTAHRVSDKNRPPRPACYRDTLAEDNFLFLPGFEPERPKDGRCYLVLAHMPQEDRIRELGSLRLGAPSPSGDRYIDYWDILVDVGSAPVPQEIIEEQAKPKLRVLQRSGESKDSA